MTIAQFIWFCECCGAEHRENMAEIDPGAGGPVWVHRNRAYDSGWRHVSDGKRLIECCPDCMRSRYWEIAAGTHTREERDSEELLRENAIRHGQSIEPSEDPSS